MCIQHEKTKRLNEQWIELIDTANMMVSLVKAIDRQDDLAGNILIKALKVIVRDTVANVMVQEHQLEYLLETKKPEAYAEWLMSVSPQYKVFQRRKERHETRRYYTGAAAS